MKTIVKLALAVAAVIVAVVLLWPHRDEPTHVERVPAARDTRSVAGALHATRQIARALPPGTPAGVEQPADLPQPGIPAWVTPLPGQNLSLPEPSGE